MISTQELADRMNKDTDLEVYFNMDTSTLSEDITLQRLKRKGLLEYSEFKGLMEYLGDKGRTGGQINKQWRQQDDH